MPAKKVMQDLSLADWIRGNPADDGHVLALGDREEHGGRGQLRGAGELGQAKAL
jgi:hypothetical protein